MKQTELIGAFEAGDMGDVEFFEWALAAGVPLDTIAAALAALFELELDSDEL